MCPVCGRHLVDHDDNESNFCILLRFREIDDSDLLPNIR